MCISNNVGEWPAGYRIARIFRGREFRGLFIFAKILFANICMRAPRPLALALVRGVANVKAIRENFIREIR